MNGVGERIDTIRRVRDAVLRDGAFGEEDRWLILDACQQIEALPPDRHISARILVHGIVSILDDPKYKGKLWESEVLYKDLLIHVLLACDQLDAETNSYLRAMESPSPGSRPEGGTNGS